MIFLHSFPYAAWRGFAIVDCCERLTQECGASSGKPLCSGVAEHGKGGDLRGYSWLMRRVMCNVTGDGRGPSYSFVYPNVMVNRYSLWMGTMRVGGVLFSSNCFP